ncbi:MAG TPA: hypothetical protein VFY90_07195 [Tepidiformaceae bacterium]|nr:hypothetical protein [Tepidiformaceae bacterium]
MRTLGVLGSALIVGLAASHGGPAMLAGPMGRSVWLSMFLGIVAVIPFM